jgi:PAS domain S-box-containing protein
MTPLSRHVLVTLWQDGDFVLSRSILVGEAAPVLVLTPASNRPAPAIIARLDHAYALRDELEPSSVARPLSLVHHRGLPALLLEDPGGDLLARLLGKPWELPQFLRVAIGVAVALGRLHARGLIHRDVNPAKILVNPAKILVNPATGQAWLIGICFVSRLPRAQVPALPEEIAGTLAYMAPEQTGRMNRSIDARSDLYSFGATLYEMLTGTLPFTATDPMEWVHCHIARQPMPPNERLNGIPEQISAIIIKLLSKTAEKRYQTAAGVEADLRTCLAAWDTLGRIDPFPLGANDISDRLLIPEKLYGRDAERELLVDVFNRVVTSGRAQLALVSGYSGVGKSSIVNELHKEIVPQRGNFISGKFDQQKPDVPYATLAQAFQGLVRQILSKSEEEVDRWRDTIREAVGTNGQLMVNLIPELGLIIGKQPPVPDLPPEAAQNRFQMLFVRFLDVFARAEHPLALFLDDLQWLDRATLELLKRLFTEADARHLLLVGAYRDNEVNPSHPLAQTLEKIRMAGAAVQEIVLAPLSVDDMDQLVMDSLDCEPDRARPLAQLMHEKTGGNPFFAIQFLMALAEEGLLAFEPRAGIWTWDLSGIQTKRYSGDVVELVAEKLKRLPQTTQQALKQLACLGNSAKISTLNLVYRESEESTQAELWNAVRAGFVFSVEAEAITADNAVTVNFGQAFPTPAEPPDSILRYVIRTQESVILDDASVRNVFSEDQYVRQQRPRSILCLPLVKQARLMGVLYLENNLVPRVFTTKRLAMLELLASQAAISLDHARLYADLRQENNDRRKAEEALRVSEERWSKLAENSSAGIALVAPDGRFIAANLALQKMLGYTQDELQGYTVSDITYEEDRAATEARIAEAYERQRRVHRVEKRYLRKDGGVMWTDVSTVFVPASGNNSAFFSVVIVDITERKRAEEKLHQKEVSLREAQTELAHVSRVTTMGELAASIAHEVNQPLAGIVTNASASLRWLAGDSPNLAEAREAIRRIIRDGNRAGDVVAQMRALFKKASMAKEPLDINEAVKEVVILTHGEARKNKVALRTELVPNLPSVKGDRVQIQQDRDESDPERHRSNEHGGRS